MNFKELDKLMALCRRRGITHFKSTDFEFTLGHEPEKPVKRSSKQLILHNTVVPQELIDTPDELSPEDLLFYSSTGQLPRNDAQ